ncbi:phosphoesterase family YybT domain protein [Clostridioides difficile Y358]|nr:phosphoesterase family YybT domain protein [Clostridioides difficile Y358]
MVFHNWRTTNIRRHEWTEYIQNLSLDIDETTKKAIINLPIPLCILEFDGNISWYNGKFYDMIGQKDLLDKNIEDIVKNLNLRKVLNENKEMYTEINYKEKEYTIIYNVIKNDQEKNPKYLMILYWIDKTEYLKVKQNYDDEKNAMMLIQVDGYDEVLKSAAEDKRALINVEVEKILSALELNSNGALRRTSKDKFFLVMHKKELKKLEAEKFSILDTIRHIDYGNNLPVL